MILLSSQPHTSKKNLEISLMNCSTIPFFIIRYEVVIQNGILKFEKTNSLHNGGMFGETALIERKGRNAQCIAMKATDLGLLDYDNYSKIFLKMQEEEQKFKKNFFERVVLKDQNLWDQAKLIMSYFEKKFYPRGYQLFKRGDPCQKIWIIIEGQVVFWDNAIFQQKQDKSIDSHIRNFSKRRMDLVLLKDGEIIGEEGLYEEYGRDNFEYCASVDAEGYFYECSKKALRNACEQLPIMRRFFKLQIEGKRKILSEMQRGFTEKIKDKKMELESSKSPGKKKVEITANKRLVLAAAQKTLTDDDKKQSKPQLKLEIGNTGSEVFKTWGAKGTGEKFFKDVTRTKINDHLVVFNKTQNFTFLEKPKRRHVVGRFDAALSVFVPPVKKAPADTLKFLSNNDTMKSLSNMDKIYCRIMKPDAREPERDKDREAKTASPEKKLVRVRSFSPRSVLSRLASIGHQASKEKPYWPADQSGSHGRLDEESVQASKQSASMLVSQIGFLSGRRLPLLADEVKSASRDGFGTVVTKTKYSRAGHGRRFLSNHDLMRLTDSPTHK